MKSSRLIIAIAIIVAIFGGIWASDSLGLWKTTASRNLNKGQNSRISEPHEEEGSEEELGLEVNGKTTVSMALEMGIPEEVLLEYLGSVDNPDALIKDLLIENGYSFGKTKEILNSYITDD
jgi:hypothetical protein